MARNFWYLGFAEGILWFTSGQQRVRHLSFTIPSRFLSLEMDKIRIVGVPEHFNFPWIKTVEEQALQEMDISLEWKDEPKGSGAMNKALREGQADVAIILTESFIKDKIEGNPAKIIGYHVATPLLWGIHVSSQFQVNHVEEISNKPFLISRYGSGSHLMAFLLAEKNKWDMVQLHFEEVGDLDGALKAMQTATPKIFLWEKYTTIPYVKKGIINRVGEIPTPWPCFVVVASPEALACPGEPLKKLMAAVYSQSTLLQHDPDLPNLLSTKYGIELGDIQEWLQQTHWANHNEMEKKDLTQTMDTLKNLGLISSTVPLDELVEKKLVNLV
jgi:ABC-type nitrate/sulfonate/bicarbonate transport system substrate-binding protein